MAIKNIHYDARSINPNVGDKVEVIVKLMGEPAEKFEAIYMGSVQIEQYTTPYFKFLVNNFRVRLVNANDVREWSFQIRQPDLSMPRLTETGGDDDIEF